MYGTVARMRVKDGHEDQFAVIGKELGMGQVPGEIAAYAYQMDSDPQEYFLVALFESKEAYVANAQSPEQHARFMKLMQVLEAEPEWHDGEVVYATG